MRDHPSVISSRRETLLFELYLSASWTYTLRKIHVSLITLLWNGREVVADSNWIGNRSRCVLPGLCLGLLGRCPVSTSLLTEGVDRGLEGGEEVLWIEGADELVALELLSDRVLEFGEHEGDAVGIQFLVEISEHVGSSGINVGHRLSGNDNPAWFWLGRSEVANLITKGAGVGEEQGGIEAEDHKAR
jgi:hypothetical protein